MLKIRVILKHVITTNQSAIINMENQSTLTSTPPKYHSPLIPLGIFLAGVLVGMGIVIGFLFTKYRPVLSTQNITSPTPTPTSVETSSQQVLGIRLTQCCSCPTIIDSSQIGRNGWIFYEQGKDYSALRPKICSSPNIGMCAPCPPLETKLLSCQYNGKIYKNGETVSVDKCNSCSCDNGQVACTLMACE